MHALEGNETSFCTSYSHGSPNLFQNYSNWWNSSTNLWNGTYSSPLYYARDEYAFGDLFALSTTTQSNMATTYRNFADNINWTDTECGQDEEGNVYIDMEDCPTIFTWWSATVNSCPSALYEVTGNSETGYPSSGRAPFDQASAMINSYMNLNNLYCQTLSTEP